MAVQAAGGIQQVSTEQAEGRAHRTMERMALEAREPVAAFAIVHPMGAVDHRVLPGMALEAALLSDHGGLERRIVQIAVDPMAGQTLDRAPRAEQRIVSPQSDEAAGVVDCLTHRMAPAAALRIHPLMTVQADRGAAGPKRQQRAARGAMGHMAVHAGDPIHVLGDGADAGAFHVPG